MPKKVTANGKTFTFDDNTTEEEIGVAIDDFFANEVKPVDEVLDVQETTIQEPKKKESASIPFVTGSPLPIQSTQTVQGNGLSQPQKSSFWKDAITATKENIAQQGKVNRPIEEDIVGRNISGVKSPIEVASKPQKKAIKVNLNEQQQKEEDYKQSLRDKINSGIPLDIEETKYVKKAFGKIAPQIGSLSVAEINQGLFDANKKNTQQRRDELLKEHEFADVNNRIKNGEVSKEDLQIAQENGLIPPFLKSEQAEQLRVNWNADIKNAHAEIDNALSNNISSIVQNQQTENDRIDALKAGIRSENYYRKEDTPQRVAHIKDMENELFQLETKRKREDDYLNSLVDNTIKESQRDIMMMGGFEFDKDNRGLLTEKGRVEVAKAVEDYVAKQPNSKKFLLTYKNSGGVKGNTYLEEVVAKTAEILPKYFDNYYKSVDEISKDLPEEAKGLVKQVAGIDGGTFDNNFRPKLLNEQEKVSAINTLKFMEMKGDVDSQNAKFEQVVNTPQVKSVLGQQLTDLENKYNNKEIDGATFKNERLKLLYLNPQTKPLAEQYIQSVTGAQNKYEKDINDYLKSIQPDFAKYTKIDNKGNIVSIAGMKPEKFASVMTELQSAKQGSEINATKEVIQDREQRGNEVMGEPTDMKIIQQGFTSGLNNMYTARAKWLYDQTGIDFFNDARIGGEMVLNTANQPNESTFAKDNFTLEAGDWMGALNPAYIFHTASSSAPYMMEAMGTGIGIGGIAKNVLLEAGLGEGVALSRSGRLIQKSLAGASGGSQDAFSTMVSNYNDLVKEGFSVKDADRISKEAFVKEVVPDMLFSGIEMEGLFRATTKPTLKNVLKRTATTFLEQIPEGAQEAIQGYALEDAKGTKENIFNYALEDKDGFNNLMGGFAGGLGSGTVVSAVGLAKDTYGWNKLYNISTSDMQDAVRYSAVANMVNNPSDIKSQSALDMMKLSMDDYRKVYMETPETDKLAKDKARQDYSNSLRTYAYAKEYNRQAQKSNVEDIHADYKAHNRAVANSYQKLADNAEEANKKTYQKQADHYTQLADKAEYGQQTPIYAFETNTGRVFITESTAKTLAEGSILDKNDKFNDAVKNGVITGIQVIDDAETSKKLSEKFAEAQKTKAPPIAPIISEKQGNAIDNSNILQETPEIKNNDTQDTQTTGAESTTTIGQNELPKTEIQITENDTEIEVGKPISATLEGKPITIEKTETGYTYTTPKGRVLEVSETEYQDDIANNQLIIEKPKAVVGSTESTPIKSESGSPATETAPKAVTNDALKKEGENKDGTVYKSTTKEKDGLVITNYEAYRKEDGKKYSISGRKLTKEEFLSEYEVDEDGLDLLDGAEQIVIRETRNNKGKLGISVRLKFPDGWIGAEIAATPTPTAVTNDATGGKKLSFSEVPVFVASREEGKKAEGQIVEVLSNLGLGQVLSNSDGEIKIVTEKSTDKKGNTLIGITTFERAEDGSLRQTSDTVFAKKNADGKASSDYNPHTTARDNSGKQITVTDEITDDFIDLSKENVMVTDKDGNLVKTEAFSTFKIADQKPTAVTNDALKDENTVSNDMAADYLLTGGFDTVLSTDYLLKGISGVFSNASGLIDKIRNSYAKELSDKNLVDIKNFVGTETYNKIVAEIRDALSKSYSNQEVQNILDEVLKRPTGMPQRLGAEIESKLSALATNTPTEKPKADALKDVEGGKKKVWMRGAEKTEDAVNRLVETVNKNVEYNSHWGYATKTNIDRDGKSEEVELREKDGKYEWYYEKSKKPFASFDNTKDAVEYIMKQPFWDNGELNPNGRDDNYFKKSNAEYLQREIENGNVLEDITNGDISAKEAIKLIENAGLKVPKEISALATNTVEQTTKNNNDAIQEQTANESVLRTEQPEMGLQEVGEGNTKSESVTEQVKTTAKEETVTPIQRITGNKDAITLSGLTEVERQKQIIERDNSLKLSKAKEDESKLSEQVRRFNEMRRNDAKRPRLLNDIKKQALEQGFEVKYNGVSVEVFKKNKSGKPTKINFYLSDIGRRSVTDEKALHERSEAVQELYVKLMDLDIDLDARNSDDNSRFSESQIQSAITDIENGIPSRQANEILNKVEKLAETGKLEVGDKVSGYKSIPIDELITEAEAVRDEQLFKDLTNDEVFELYANDILASNENDNIINQEYERINNEGAVSNTPQKIATNSGGTNEKTPNEEGTNKATSNKTQESGIVPDKIVPETSIVETGKKIADAIRKLKSDKDSLQTDLTLGLKNLALEEIAQLIEDGAVVIDAITKVLSDAKYNSIDKDEIKKIALSPIVLGSGKKVSYFHSNTTGIYGKLRLRNKSGFFGIYFSPSKQYSKKFGDFTYKTDLYPQNTLTIKDKSEFKKYGNIFNISKDSYDSLIKEGYDSIAWYRDGKLMEFIVLDTDIIGDMDLHFLNHPTKTSKSEKNLSLADKIRALKSPKGSLQTDLTLGLKNLALEEIAQLVEDGAQVIDAIAQVLKNAKYNSLNPDDLNKEIVRKLAPISEQNKAFLDNVIKDIESGKTTLEEAVKELNDDLPKRFAEKYIKYLNDNYTPKQEIKNEKTEEAKTKTEVLSEKTSNGNTRDENDFIHEILSKEINETEYPLIAQDVNGSAKQETAKTQGEVQDRSVDGNYVKVTIENLKEIALETSKKLEDKFGDKWVEKTLNFLESRSVSNAQMIGVLNAMSTKVMDDMKATDLSEGKYNSLRAIQKRIDNATNKISRIASIALNMRKVLRKFAEGGNINEVLAQVVLTNEVRAEMKAIDESIKRIKTDEEINNATTPTNPKGTQKTSTQSSKSQTSKEELLSNVTSKADEYRQKTGRTQKNLRSTMKDIAERIKKNCK